MADLIPKISSKYAYSRLERIDAPTGRTYRLLNQDSVPVPSVTTILSATKDRAHLDAWEARVGKEEAERIRSTAAEVGTHMHAVVENVLLGHPLTPPANWLAVRGYWMGYKLVDEFFGNLQEVWGSEIPLYYPSKYAGTSDCIGVYRGAESIIDFKQTNKMKRRSWIEDYFVQLAAYAMAHDVMYGTKINQGVILMVSQDGETMEFTTADREFDSYKDAWMRRVEQYLAKKEAPGLAGAEGSTRSGEKQ